MNQELGFETMPFEIAPEFPGELFEEESEWGRRGSFAGGGSRYSRPGSRPSPRPGGAKRPPIPRPRPILRGPRGPWAVVREPYGLVGEPYPGEPEPASSERVRWIQDCLNQASGLQLPVTGVMGPETRSAVRSFQRERGLRASGIVGPDTERALQALCRNDKVVSITEDEQFRGLLASEDDLAAEEEIVINNDTTVMIEPIKTYPLYLEESWRNLDKDESSVYVIYDITTTASPKAIYVGESKDPKTRFSGRLKVLKDFGIDLSTLRSRVARTYRVSLKKEPLPDAIQFRDKGSTTIMPKTLD